MGQCRRTEPSLAGSAPGTDAGAGASSCSDWKPRYRGRDHATGTRDAFHRHPHPPQQVVFELPRPPQGFTATFASFWEAHPEFQLKRVNARDPDLRTRLEILRREPGAQSADRGALQRVRGNAAQFQRLASQRSDAARHTASSTDVSSGMLLALAYPDRVAKRRAAAGGRYLLANGAARHSSA